MSRLRTLSRDLEQTSKELEIIRREREELDMLEARMREKLRDDEVVGEEEHGGSMIEHNDEALPEERVEHLESELQSLMREMHRLQGVRDEVLRKIENRREHIEDGGHDVEEEEEEEAGSLDRDDNNYSTVAPSIRREILQEFDRLIESNEMMDADLLQAVVDRLWSIENEDEKQRLIRQLRNADDDDERDTEEEYDAQWNLSVTEGLAEACRDDIEKVEEAIAFLSRRISELCLKTLPFTLFNGQLLLRCEALIKEAISIHRVNLLADACLFDAIKDLLTTFERKSVTENIDDLISKTADLLYDEMLFANLLMREISRFDSQSSSLRLQARKVDKKIANLEIEQSKQQKVLMRERENRLKKIRNASLSISERQTSNNASLDFSFRNRTVVFDPEDELLVDSPGGFAFSPRQLQHNMEPHSPSALHIYEQMLVESSPVTHNTSVDIVNRALAQNYSQ